MILLEIASTQCLEHSQCTYTHTCAHTLWMTVDFMLTLYANVSIAGQCAGTSLCISTADLVFAFKELAYFSWSYRRWRVCLCVLCVLCVLCACVCVNLTQSEMSYPLANSALHLVLCISMCVYVYVSLPDCLCVSTCMCPLFSFVLCCVRVCVCAYVCLCVSQLCSSTLSAEMISLCLSVFFNVYILDF